MHFCINVCCCCLKSDVPLSEYSIKYEGCCGIQRKCIQQIQCIYSDVQPNTMFPFQFCYDCQRLASEAYKLKEYLDYQNGNEECTKLLLKENTCSSCLEYCAFLSNRPSDLSALEMGNKTYSEIITALLPQYHFDPLTSYKYCQMCSNFIKSLHTLKILLARYNSLYAKYCSVLSDILSSTKQTFSQLSIILQRIAIPNTSTACINTSIKEEVCTDLYLNIKIEHDEEIYNHSSKVEATDTFCEKTFNDQSEFENPNCCYNKNLSSKKISSIMLVSKDPKCDKDFKEKRHKCNYCSKSFHLNSVLKMHERTHTGEKPYKCNYCPKTFSQNAHLIRHERTHTGEKPFKCNYCSKSFTESCNLKNHERVHTGEKPYKCNHCSKSFSERGNLKTHKRIHTREKPHQCNHCSKLFYTKYHLKTHEKIHTRGSV